jgi:hypothetical protein
MTRSFAAAGIVVRKRQQSETLVFGVGLGSSDPRVVAAEEPHPELQNQYLVGYVPTKSLDGKYRKLKVEVNRRGLYVRHRGGYLALPHDPGSKSQ